MKYMGSKARFAKEVLPIILKGRKEGQVYIEPFAGGMNVISEVGGVRLANDIHPYLIPMWKELVNGWVPSQVSKEQYIDIRNNPDNYPPHIVGWVGFNCSYSGKWFGGFAGTVQTKTGVIRDYQQEAISNVNKQVKKMTGVAFQNKHYSELVLPLHSIIYCDPPYAGTTEYATKFNHDFFWEWVRSVSQENTVFVSEYAAPIDFQCIWQKEARSSLSANGRIGGSKLSLEKLFVYKFSKLSS